MPIICPYCKQDIPIKDYDAHLTESHPEAIIDRIRYTITKAKDQVGIVVLYWCLLFAVWADYWHSLFT